jgi:integrase
MQFTKSAIAGLALPAGKAEHFEWDDDLPGFGIRLRAGGSRTWCVQYRVGRQGRRESLGDVRKVSLEDARRIARQRFAKVELGVDPGAEKAARARAQLTLAKVIGRYLDAKKDIVRPNTYQQAEYHFRVLWEPLHDLPIDAIKRAEVAAQLQVITKRNGRTAAARARGNLSALFSWGMKEGLCEGNPVVATNDPAEGIPARERVLSDAEIRTVWNACRDDDFGRIVRLLLVCGCRRQEIGGLRWDEISFDSGVMTISGERTKNRRTLELTLPPLALDILRSAPRRDGRDFVFGNRGGAFSTWSYSTIALNNRVIEAEGKPLPRWTLHDLRRTMRTGLGKIGIPPHVAELCINHVKGGVQAIYDRHTYQPQIAAALAAWAAHIEQLVSSAKPDKVVSLR